MIDQLAFEGPCEQMGRQCTPQQSNGRHPFGVGQGFNGSKFKQSAASTIETNVPELVETNLTPVSVATTIGVKMPQRFAYQMTMVSIR